MKIEILNYSDKKAAQEFVDFCECSFNNKLTSVCQKIAENDSIRAITLAGPTCSGKTTAASRITDELEKLGKKARLISIDDFYRPKAELQRLGITDVEGACAIDTDLFSSVASDLARFRETSIPTYDFVTKTRPYLTPYTPDDNDIYIFEGIQAVYPEILSCLTDFNSVSVFINVGEDLFVNGIAFDKNELRLIRRIVRDYHHRNADVAYTMGLWENVRLNEENNIFPHSENSDFKINSMIPYEVFILGQDFLTFTEGYTSDKPFYKLIVEIRNKLLSISDHCFELSMIPYNSLLREFIA